MQQADDNTTEQAGTDEALKVAIVVGSTRPGRKADAVVGWVHGVTSGRDDATFEVVDIRSRAMAGDRCRHR